MTSREVSKFLGGAWLCILTLSGLFAGCHEKSASTGDSETHFLQTCTDSCSGGLTCLCGVCTKPCTEQANCGELSPSASCEGSCSDSSSRVCDLVCSDDSDCSNLGAEFGCTAGHCRQASPISVGGAGGAGGSGEAGRAGSAGAGAVDVGAGAGGTPPLSACQAEPDPTPSFPAPTALDPDSVARAALVMGSCMPDDGVPRSAAHLWLGHLGAPQLTTRFGAQLDCFANARCGCAAVEQCVGWVYRQEPTACASVCDGDVFTGCGDGGQISVDCSRFGLSCDAAANCVAEAPPVACDGTEPPSCTAQGEVLACDRGALRKTPCQAQGFVCMDGKCMGDGATCAGSTASDVLGQPLGMACAGDALQACLGGRVTVMDCAAQGPGFSCRSFGGAFFCGLGSECVPADNYYSPEPATCSGTTLTFCNAGRLEHLECTALGFTGCEIDEKLGHYGCTPGVVLQ